jgi:predicted  nucleic acid-binding Zn-ribbon protein
MANAKDSNDSGGVDESKQKKKEEGALGNLPPLSDFDSEEFQSDTALPPLGSPRSDAAKGPSGGLPPLGELSVETPAPTGGNVKPEPPGFEMAAAEFESPTFDTPPPKPRSSKGFQDPAADSDFSPETPEIGPGPDSDMDTPMFDSAFGGAAGGGFTPAFDTPAPTQAMETPMFGSERPSRGGVAAPEQPGFDEGAFMPGGAFEPGVTPAPDFSLDTGLGAAKQPPLPPEPEKKKKRVSVGVGAGPGLLVTVLAAVICLVVGLVLGPFLSTRVSFIPNPLRSQLADKDTELKSLNDKLSRAVKAQEQLGGRAVSPEEVERLLKQQEEVSAKIKQLETDQQTRQAELDKTTSQFDQVRGDLDAKNEEFVKTQDTFEDLQNQTAIVQARQMGLKAEVERLTGLVGTLEEASARSNTTKEGLQTSVERLLIDIKEGIPLTPDKFSREARLAAVEDLKAKVEAAKWVTPDLLDAYTTLYLKELDIASSTAYFYARIPVTSKIGDKETKWAECLMKGNWAVYYRTLDGKNVGSYENVAQPGQTPQYEFRETLPPDIQKHIAQEIVASRGPDAESQLKALAEKQAIMDGDASSFQRVFSSL